jgi:hypothetical protein
MDFSNNFIDNIFIGFNSTTSNLYVLICDDGKCYSSPISSKINTGFGKWIHIAITFDTKNHIIFFLDGQQVISYNSTYKCRKVLRTSCKIGRSDWYPHDVYLSAILDELKIFNRSLSATEILKEMQQLEPFEKIFL